MADDKFFLTNPSLSNYGNLSKLLYVNSKSVSKEDFIKVSSDSNTGGQESRPVKEGVEEEDVLYEEETINFLDD